MADLHAEPGTQRMELHGLEAQLDPVMKAHNHLQLDLNACGQRAPPVFKRKATMMFVMNETWMVFASK